MENTETDFQRFDLMAGLGGVYSFDDALFNLPDDAKVGLGGDFNAGLYRNLNPNFAIGPRVNAYINAFSYIRDDGTGLQDSLTYLFTAYNVGVSARYIFYRGKIQPYFNTLVNLSFGGAKQTSVTSVLDTDSPMYVGITAGGGPGLMIRFGRHFGLALEGIFLFGTARWEKIPAPNSSDDKFNPGFAGATANFVFLWGKKDRN
jgi:hypothetical protein